MFSCTLPAYSSNRKIAKKAREKERKRSLQKGRDRYNIVKGVGSMPDGISFESLHKKKHYLRARDNFLILEAYEDSDEYRKESTFLPLQDMWFLGYFAFESVIEPAHFIRRCGEQLILQKYENSSFFKEDASFRMSKKVCVACVRVGSRVWTKTEKGIFHHGNVVAIDDDVHIKLDNGKKIRHSKTEPEAIVADVLPHPLEVEVGSRVLARWYGRQESYYPGIVIGVKRSYFDVKFDDGDKGCNELNEIRMMRPPEIQETKGIPRWSSLDGLPRVGGVCIDSNDTETTITSDCQETLNGHASGYETGSLRDSPVDSGRSDQTDDLPLPPPEVLLDHCDDEDFGYENHYQYNEYSNYLTPGYIPHDDEVTVERQASQFSGSSYDSGYHGHGTSNHLDPRQRRSGLWALHHDGDTVAVEGSAGPKPPRFLSPHTCMSSPNISALGVVVRNSSEASVRSQSSLDSGYQGCCRHNSQSDTKTLASACNNKSIQNHRSFDGAYEHFHHFHTERHYHGYKPAGHAHNGGKFIYEMQRFRSNSASNRTYHGNENYHEHNRLTPKPQKELVNGHEERWSTGDETRSHHDDVKKEQCEQFQKLKIGAETVL